MQLPSNILPDNLAQPPLVRRMDILVIVLDLELSRSSSDVLTCLTRLILPRFAAIRLQPPSIPE